MARLRDRRDRPLICTPPRARPSPRGKPMRHGGHGPAPGHSDPLRSGFSPARLLPRRPARAFSALAPPWFTTTASRRPKFSTSRASRSGSRSERGHDLDPHDAEVPPLLQQTAHLPRFSPQFGRYRPGCGPRRRTCAPPCSIRCSRSASSGSRFARTAFPSSLIGAPLCRQPGQIGASTSTASRYFASIAP